MEAYIYEFLGTFILVLLGNGVVAATILNDTKANFKTGLLGNWVLITLGWGLGVFMGVIVAGPHSGAHINPAVTISLAVAGKFSWNLVTGYIIAQMLGAFVAGVIVYIMYKLHYDRTEDPGTKLATFSTGPAIRNTWYNLFSEMLGTFVLLFLIFHLAGPTLETANLEDVKIGLGSIGALPVALVVVGIGMSLGATTGYAINPARDLGPRIAHALLPIRGKGNSDWGYSWIPVAGPIIGGIIAAILYMAIN